MVTLGRLVGGIAHELNNPAGAICSFSSTMARLTPSVLKAPRELLKRISNPDELAIAQALLDAAFEVSRHAPPDSRTRRELEQFLEEELRRSAVPAARTIARRFARMGMDLAEIEAAMGILRRLGDDLSLFAEEIYQFGRSQEILFACAGQIAQIVDGLKTYAHLDQSAAESRPLQRGIDAALSVMGSRIPDGVEVVTRFQDLPPVFHRPGEMTQVWTNLIDNALRAMEDQGTLTIETFDEPEQDRVRVTITDTGRGITPEAAGRVFDLGFTTRGPGAGLGFGLPICKRIVEARHGGDIWFRSIPGKQTTFSVTLSRNALTLPGSEREGE